MSFLMFAARKLQIKREMNAKNYELQLITQAATDAAKKVADAQEAQAAAKNQVSIFTSQLQAQGQNAALVALKAQTGIDASQINSGNMTQADMQAIQFALNQGTQAGNALASALTSITDSIFSAQNKAELARLTAQQTALDLRKGSLETQVNSLKGQYDAAEKAETESAQSLAPKFVVA